MLFAIIMLVTLIAVTEILDSRNRRISCHFAEVADAIHEKATAVEKRTSHRFEELFGRLDKLSKRTIRPIARQRLVSIPSIPPGFKKIASYTWASVRHVQIYVDPVKNVAITYTERETVLGVWPQKLTPSEVSARLHTTPPPPRDDYLGHPEKTKAIRTSKAHPFPDQGSEPITSLSDWREETPVKRH